MNHTYKAAETAVLRGEENGWKHQRGWRIKEGSIEDFQPVMLHTLYAGADNEMLLDRYYEEVRKVLFKASNLPEADQCITCLDTARKLPGQKDGAAYQVVTNGWYETSLHDLFARDGAKKHLGDQLREKLKKAEERAALWQALARLADMLLRLQSSKLFCPALTLRSFCFLADSKYEFDLQAGGEFRFENLRLCELEKILPFGDLFQGRKRLEEVCWSDLPVHVATWRSFAEIVIDILTTPPVSESTVQEKHKYRQAKLKEKKGKADALRPLEHTLLARLLEAEDNISLGNIPRAIEEICYDLERGTSGGEEAYQLCLIYQFDVFKHDVMCAEYGQEPGPSDVEQYLISCLSRAKVWYNPSAIIANQKCDVTFQCDDGLWLNGRAFLDYKNNTCTTKRLMLTRGSSQRRNTGRPASLNGIRLHLDALSALRNSPLPKNANDWTELLKQRDMQTYRQQAQDVELTILASLELNNQIESLMGFLNLCLFRVTDLSSSTKQTKLVLTPYTPEENATVPTDRYCPVKNTWKIQQQLRQLLNVQDSYPKIVSAHFKDVHEKMLSSPKDMEKHSHLLIVGKDHAGSLSISIGGGREQLDAKGWQVDWKSVYAEDAPLQIIVTRAAPLDDREKLVITKHGIVSVRFRGHYGQMEVIKRRTDAFEHLKKYGMLLQQLVTPGRKTGELSALGKPFREWAVQELDQSSLSEEKRLDANKLAVIEDAYCNTPLFILQGPPGTGKSETVCSLVKLIFTDDPLAQILLTSRENATVKELLRKLFDNSRSWKDVPIFRVSTKIQNSLKCVDSGEEGSELKFTMDAQAVDIIKRMQKHSWQAIVQNNTAVENICKQWQAELEQANTAQKDAVVLSVSYLLQQSANLIFTTASDKTLADMVCQGRMLDWAFVEEAGKTPFYDLILPMLVAQRWMLLGDPQQLEPFQASEFTRLMENYTRAITSLQEIKELGQTGRKEYISTDHLEEALNRNDARFFEKQWVHPFKKLFDDVNATDLTREQANGQLAAMLNVVYRMPPALTKLDNVFYTQELIAAPQTRADKNNLQSLAPDSSKSSPLSEPAWMRCCNAVWLDTRGAEGTQQREELHQFYNPGEARLIVALLNAMQVKADLGDKPSLIILTPYRRQVKELKRCLEAHNDKILERFAPTDAAKSRGQLWATTIDSFQGCQADIVIVSMVRNTPGLHLSNRNTIHFVADQNRINVMISRAKRLLIIVGNYEYFETCCPQKNPQIDKFYGFLQRYKNMADADESKEYITFAPQTAVQALSKQGK